MSSPLLKRLVVTIIPILEVGLLDPDPDTPELAVLFGQNELATVPILFSVDQDSPQIFIGVATRQYQYQSRTGRAAS